MSKYASPSVALLVDGYDLTPALVESLSRAHESITQQTAPFGTASEAHTPVGVTRDTLTVGGGIYDQAVDPLHHGKIAAGGVSTTATPRVVCVLHEGQAKGKHFVGYEGAYSQKSEALDAVGALTKANVTYLVSGAADEGVILQELAAKTADWDTTATPVDEADDPSNRRIPITSSSVANPTHIVFDDPHGLVTGDVIVIFDHASVAPDINDNPAAAEAWKLIGHTVTVVDDDEITIPVDVSDGGTGGYAVVVQRAKGGAGYLQVTDGATFTNFVGTIQHSVDASTWVDLVVFADTTTSYHAKERVATATTTTAVRRYLSVSGNVTGAGSITAFIGFARG